MAKMKEKTLKERAPLIIGLSDPGMTPMLRSGIGGLAASIRAIARSTGQAKWPAPVEIGGANFKVEPRRIAIDWGQRDPANALDELFKRSFLIDRDGLITCAAWSDGKQTLPLALRARLQSAVKRTILQHGTSTSKKGRLLTRAEEIDGQSLSVQYQPYARYAHQDAAKDVVVALSGRGVKLAGWAHPGATARHEAFLGYTKCEYSASQALAGCFALAGSVSFEASRGGAGVLVILVPSDLVAFAKTRPLVTPHQVSDAVIGGVGDAVLLVQARLHARDLRDEPGVSETAAILLKATPWASQQKSRVAVITVKNVSTETLVTYEDVVRTLPSRVRQAGGDDSDDDASFFVTTSALRSFVASNLALGRRWYDGFAVERTPEKKPRFLHAFRDKKNLGAMFLDERKGLITMVERHLGEAEAALVRSVHVALRQRFGAIAEESSSIQATMKNRMGHESEKWRMAFAGAKTQEQVRGALADLWSRAGPNSELQRSWERVLELLRADRWQAARDLALIALASYQGKGQTEADVDNNGKGDNQ